MKTHKVEEFDCFVARLVKPDDGVASSQVKEYRFFCLHPYRASSVLICRYAHLDADPLRRASEAIGGRISNRFAVARREALGHAQWWFPHLHASRYSAIKAFIERVSS